MDSTKPCAVLISLFSKIDKDDNDVYLIRKDIRGITSSLHT